MQPIRLPLKNRFDVPFLNFLLAALAATTASRSSQAAPPPAAAAAPGGNDIIDRYRGALADNRAAGLTPWQHQVRLPGANEKKILGEIRRQSIAERMRTISGFLAAADGENLPIEYVIHAAVGTSRDVRSRMIDEVLRPQLTKPAADAGQRDAVVRAAMELDAYEEIGGLAPLAIQYLAGPGSKSPPGSSAMEKCWWRAFERARTALSPDEALPLCDVLLQSKQDWNPFVRSTLTQFLAGQLEKLDDDQLRRREAQFVRVANPRTIRSVSPLLCERLAAHGIDVQTLLVRDERERAAAELQIKRLKEQLHSPPAAGIDVGRFMQLSDFAQFTPDERRKLSLALLERIRKSNDRNSLTAAANMLAALADQYSVEQAEEVIQKLYPVDGGRNTSFGSPRLPTDEKLWARYLASMPPPNAGRTAFYLAAQKDPSAMAALRALGGRVPADQRVALMKQMLSSFAQGNNEMALAIGPHALALEGSLREHVGSNLMRRLSEALPPKGKPDVAKLMRGAMCAAALAEIKPKPEISHDACKQLLDGYKSAVAAKTLTTGHFRALASEHPEFPRICGKLFQR